MQHLYLADVFSALLKGLGHQIGRFPHGPDAPRRIYNFLSQTPPLFVVAALAAAGIGFITFRRWQKQTVLLAIAIFFASFFVLSSGRAVIHAAIKLPYVDRPACLADAVVHGAVWDIKKLKEVPNCKPPASPKIAAARDLVDSGADGVLAGPIQSSSWQANVSAVAPSPSWQARSVDRAGNRYLYLEQGNFAYSIRPCPEIAGNTQSYTKDTTGIKLVDSFAKLAVRSQFSIFVTLRTKGIVQSRYPHVYRFTDASGNTTGYLLPVSGVHGDCAILTGPYVAAQVHRELPNAAPHSVAALHQLDVFAGTVNVVDLKNG